MTEAFAADPTRLIIAALLGLAVLLVLIIKTKFQPVIAILIGLVAGMPVPASSPPWPSPSSPAQPEKRGRNRSPVPAAFYV